MSNYLQSREVARLGELLADQSRQIAQLKKRTGAGVVVIDDGEAAVPADPPPSFWRDRFPTPTGTLSGAAASATLTYTPLPHSLHLYLNGLELDEGTDYTLADNEVTFTGASPTTGDLVEARYAFTDSTPSDADVYGDDTFAPTYLTDLALWLDASQIVGTADGADLTTWPDLSGHGRDGTHPLSSTTMPKYRSTGSQITPTGGPAVQFDGVDAYLHTTNPPSQDVTLFVVARVNSFAAPHTLYGPQASNCLQLRTGTTSGKLQELRSATLQNTESTIAATLNTYGVFVLTKASAGAGGAGAYYVDGASAGTFTDTTNFSAVGDGTVGANNGPVEPLDGSITELIVYNRVLSTTERQQVETYLQTKHGTP